MKNLFFISTLLFLSACTKEKVLPRNGFPDQGDIFLSAYITNTKDNRIAIFGRQLLDQQIELYFDTGLGFFKLPLKYLPKDFEFESDLSKIRFRPYQVYGIKLISRVFNDSLVLYKTLPDSFKPSANVTYPNKAEYYCNLKVNDAQNQGKYTHDLRYDGSWFDTTSFTISNSGNVYRSMLLPYLRDIVGATEPLSSIETLNGISVFEGVRFPFHSLYTNNSSCDYNSFVQKYNVVLTRFYSEDFEYINSLCDNVANYGNPFFQNYQPKGLTFSKGGKMFGIFLSSYITYTSVTIADNSDTAVKIFVRDKGVDIIGDPNYFVGFKMYKKFSNQLYRGKNCIFGTDNLIRHFYGCPGSAYRKENEATVQMQVFNYTTKTTKLTEIKTFDLTKTPISLVFEVQ